MRSGCEALLSATTESCRITASSAHASGASAPAAVAVQLSTWPPATCHECKCLELTFPSSEFCTMLALVVNSLYRGARSAGG